jgi:hypothetical protein
LELLRPPNPGHPDRPDFSCRARKGFILLDRPITLGKLEHRDGVGVGERADRPPELLTDPVDHRR